MAEKRALVIGVTGQDGHYLSKILLEMNYMVYGLTRRSSCNNLYRILDFLNNKNFELIYGDVTDQSSIINAINISNPDEIYNLAAMSFVGESWNQPVLTLNATGLGCLNCLEAIKKTNKNIKYYFASSSEQFGKVLETPQKETTPFYPKSPYGAAKVYGYNITRNYRESYGMFAVSGICFNHESKYRGLEFVTRKISNGVARIYHKLDNKIVLGNLDVERDWGHSQDYCYAMFLMLQSEEPDDYVLATGETHTILDFVKESFSIINIDNYMDYIVQDEKFMRPSEVYTLCGDSTKAKNNLGWEPKIKFNDIVKEMVLNDIDLLGKGGSYE